MAAKSAKHVRRAAKFAHCNLSAIIFRVKVTGYCLWRLLSRRTDGVSAFCTAMLLEINKISEQTVGHRLRRDERCTGFVTPEAVTYENFFAWLVC